MKLPVVLAVMLVLSTPSTFAAPAQAQLATNYVTADSDFRDVRGQLYNIARSTRWTSRRCEIVRITNSIAVTSTEEPHEVRKPFKAAPARSGNFLGERPPSLSYGDNFYTETVWKPGPMILITNLPGSLLVRRQRGEWKMIAVESFDFEGEPITLYDFGRPHVVAVIKTNSPSRKIPTPPLKVFDKAGPKSKFVNE